jgi:hypothetical protein
MTGTFTYELHLLESGILLATIDETVPNYAEMGLWGPQLRLLIEDTVNILRGRQLSDDDRRRLTFIVGRQLRKWGLLQPRERAESSRLVFATVSHILQRI